MKSASPLLSSTHSDADLIDVGSRYAATALRQHWITVKTKMAGHDFAKFGLGPDWVNGMDALADALGTETQTVDAAHEGQLESGGKVDHAAGALKEWRRLGSTAIQLTPALKEEWKGHASVGSSIPRLLQSAREMLPLVARATQTGGGDAARAGGEGLIADLVAARDTHTQALATMSPALKKLNRDKGLLYEELKRLAIGARAVAPSLAHELAPSTHLRTHHRKHAASTTNPTPPTPAS